MATSTSLVLEDGATFIIDGGTVIDGSLSVGARVKIKATPTEAGLLATEVVVKKSGKSEGEDKDQDGADENDGGGSSNEGKAKGQGPDKDESEDGDEDESSDEGNNKGKGPDEDKEKGPKNEDPESSEFELEGTLESVERDGEGSVTLLVVDGVSITVDRRTRIKGELEPGSLVSVEGVVIDGAHTASRVEAEDAPRP